MNFPMTVAFPEILAVLDPIRESVSALVSQGDSPARLAFLAAQMLRTAWPPSPLYACRLGGEGHAHCCVIDDAGRSRPEWEEQLTKELTRHAPKANRTTRTPAQRLQAFDLRNHTLAVEDIAYQDASYGALALALPKGTGKEASKAAQACLAVCGNELALRLHAEGQERRRQTVQEELAGQAWLADAGELAGPLTHEVNNFLNNLLLHVAVLESDLPETLRAELKEVRRQGVGIASLVRQFQQLRRRPPTEHRGVNLNQLIRETAEASGHLFTETGPAVRARKAPPSRTTGAGTAPSEGTSLTLLLEPDLPPAPGPASDWKRLTTFLVKNAAAAMTGGGRMTVRTGRAADRAFLAVEDTGPDLAEECLPQLFDPQGCRRGVSGLELAACKSLVKRLQGTITGANRAGGGLVITVEWPVPPPSAG
jgi:signal transduction histidine kinase